MLSVLSSVSGHVYISIRMSFLIDGNRVVYVKGNDFLIPCFVNIYSQFIVCKNVYFPLIVQDCHLCHQFFIITISVSVRK